MRVLIADDSPAVVERLADLLRDVRALNSQDGQACAGSHSLYPATETRRCDLDLQMPGGSGLDVLRAVRPDQPSLCVLICTNYHMTNIARNAWPLAQITSSTNRRNSKKFLAF